MPREPEVLAVGNINIDLSFFVERTPGPDSEIFASDFSLFSGGSASNIAVGVARLGLKSGIVGCVGGDSLGAYAVRALQREGVSTDLVKVIPGKRTGAVCVLVEVNGSRRMVAYRGANLNLQEIVDDMGNIAPRVLQVSNVSRDLWTRIKGGIAAKKGKMLVSLDPGGSSRELAADDLVGLDLLLLNEKECGMITRKSLKEGSKALKGRVNTVVIKRGKRGCLVLSEEGWEEMPAFAVDIQDPTGAGDAFDAGFIAGVVSGKSSSEAALWGSAAAAMKIRKKGAWAGLPSKESLLEFLESRTS
jgi:ribokinase